MRAATVDNVGYQSRAAAPNTGAPAPADRWREDFAIDDHATARGPVAGRRHKVPKHEIADMTAQLAIMTQAGLDLSSALSSLASQCERPALAEVLHQINELVRSGNTLSESLSLFPDVFDAAYVATIAAAEASGKMADVLKQLAQMQRNELRLRQSIKGLLTYPVMLTAISGLVVGILVVFVLPRFSEIFAQHEIELPVVTRILLAAAVEVKARWWLWAPIGSLAIAGIGLWRSTDGGRMTIDQLLLNIPAIRQVTRPLLIGRTCTLLSVLLRSGVPLLDGLRLCQRASINRVYNGLLGEIADSVVNGRGLGEALMAAQIIPISAREMLATAERTGRLGEVSHLLGSFYEEDAENRMKQFVRLLEPLITVVMGAVIAVVVMSVMLPIFDLSTAVK